MESDKSIFSTFTVLKDPLKLKVSTDSVSIDNIIFKLHYRATFGILLAGTALVCSRQFIGEHISCITDAEKLSNVIDSFCFFTSTFTVVTHMNLIAVKEKKIPHLGIGPMSESDDVVHHAYYQWVPFVLFFQALLFYLPHYIWKSAEGGRLKKLVSGLHLASLALRDDKIEVDGMTIPTKGDRHEKIRHIRAGFINRLHLNRPWAYTLGFCEVLNFINVFFQIYLTDLFLGGAFLNLGPEVQQTEFNNQINPLDRVFPKITKCTFHKYGASGTIQKHDVLCVMALNIINEKIYLFLWYWFIILAVLTSLGLLWRILTIILHDRSLYFNKIVFSTACPGKYNPWNMLKVTHDYHFSDWLFLYYIAKNSDNYVFKEMLLQLTIKLEKRKKTSDTVPYENIELLKKD